MSREFHLNHFIGSHSIWVEQVAYNLTQDSNSAQDLIQDTYVKLLELSDDRFEAIRFGPFDLNTYWVYITMKNHFLNKVKKQKETYIDVQESIIFEKESIDTTDEKELQFERLNKEINDYLDELEKDQARWFQAKLFRVYLNDGHSMESLSKHTGISKSTIFTTIRNMRLELREKFKQQYKDLQDD